VNTSTSQFLLWVKRLLIYILGLFLMAAGVVFSARSSLGVSPVSSLGNVLYQIGQSAGAPTFVNLGNCTTAVFCVYLLAELLLLGKNFKPAMLLQIAVSLLFGQLVNLASAVLAFLPAPGSYAVQLLYLLISIPLVALGILLYLTPGLYPMPGEGLSIALADRFGISVGTAKTIFDCSVVLISVVLSLLYFKKLVGVREGTVLCALLVGFVFKLLQKPLQKPLLRFAERGSKIDRALEAASQGYLTDITGKPKIIITISREFGSGGHEIAERLAERLGIPFYDTQIDRLAAQQCGIPLERLEAQTRRMERESHQSFRGVAYAMTNDALSPDEQLFVAQSKVIRQIAASGESCVILGRCSDYVLYNDPNCFRIFIHARTDVRIKRTMALFGQTEDEARRQVESIDRARAQYYKYFTGREYGKQEYYNLGFDSGPLGTEESVECIITILRRWCTVRGTHPLYML
jgi:uncharacterized membrane protein YczE/cytidylate kinase